MELADVRYLSTFQFNTYAQLASVRRVRKRIDDLYVQHSGGEGLNDEWRSLHRALDDLTLEPIELPEGAKRQMREYEERKRRGETFAQRRKENRQGIVNPPPKRERFSIRKGIDQDAGAEHTPRRIMNAELPKGIRI